MIGQPKDLSPEKMRKRLRLARKIARIAFQSKRVSKLTLLEAGLLFPNMTEQEKSRMYGFYEALSKSSDDDLETLVELFDCGLPGPAILSLYVR